MARRANQFSAATRGLFCGQKVRFEPGSLIGSIDGAMIYTAKRLIAALRNLVLDTAKSSR
jgi:hypothetical protein